MTNRSSIANLAARSASLMRALAPRLSTPTLPASGGIGASL